MYKLFCIFAAEKQINCKYETFFKIFNGLCCRSCGSYGNGSDG